MDINILDDHWLINLIQLELVFEFTENLKTVQTFLLERFYLCKCSMNECQPFV